MEYNLTEPEYNLTEPEYNLTEPEYNLPEPEYNLPEPVPLISVLLLLLTWPSTGWSKLNDMQGDQKLII